jgi:hypothetical protein
MADDEPQSRSRNNLNRVLTPTASPDISRPLGATTRHHRRRVTTSRRQRSGRYGPGSWVALSAFLFSSLGDAWRSWLRSVSLSTAAIPQ